MPTNVSQPPTDAEVARKNIEPTNAHIPKKPAASPANRMTTRAGTEDAQPTSEKSANATHETRRTYSNSSQRRNHGLGLFRRRTKINPKYMIFTDPLTLTRTPTEPRKTTGTDPIEPTHTDLPNPTRINPPFNNGTTPIAQAKDIKDGGQHEESTGTPHQTGITTTSPPRAHGTTRLLMMKPDSSTKPQLKNPPLGP
jgi:hypothetical protein